MASVRVLADLFLLAVFIIVIVVLANVLSRALDVWWYERGEESCATQKRT
jgi:hypothetical protein